MIKHVLRSDLNIPHAKVKTKVNLERFKEQTQGRSAQKRKKVFRIPALKKAVQEEENKAIVVGDRLIVNGER